MQIVTMTGLEYATLFVLIHCYVYMGSYVGHGLYVVMCFCALMWSLEDVRSTKGRKRSLERVGGSRGRKRALEV